MTMKSVQHMSDPRHVALIMDGNGRWARARKLPRVAGHRAGMEALRCVVEHAARIQLEWLTLFAFSSENWSRPDKEVDHLFELLKLFMRKYLSDLHQENIYIRIIGDRSHLPNDIATLLLDAETLTNRNTGLHLVVAFNYGGRDEIIRAVQNIASKVQSGQLAHHDINQENFEKHLDTLGMPDPDLIIRTSGEMRLSNFLLWQSAYSEFYFSSCNWPDFSAYDFDEAIQHYYLRHRRFGRVDEGGGIENIA